MWIQRNRPDWDPVLFDRFSVEGWYTPSARRRLYLEGLSRSDSSAYDNFARQTRYDALIQVATAAIKRHPELAIAECGCFRGHSSYLLASIQRDSNGTGMFHIFDSFEGLSALRTEDRNVRTTLDASELEQPRRGLAAPE
jgi:hypothetical protein